MDFKSAMFGLDGMLLNFAAFAALLLLQYVYYRYVRGWNGKRV